MREANHDEQMMRQFLLDKLELEERERIEEQFMTNEAFKEKLLMAEEGLIEDYLDNSLDDADREQFHAVFLSSPEQLEKLTMARAINDGTKAEAKPVGPSVESASEEFVGLDKRPDAKQPAKSSRRSALWIAAAAVIVILATLWLIQRSPRGQENAEDRARRLAIQAELAELNSGSRSGSEVAPGETLSVVLAPINTRASGTPNLLRRTGVAVFEFWLLPTSLDKVNFKALISKDGVAGQLEVSNLPLADKPQGRAVRLRVPTHLLGPGAYQVELRAVSINGDSVYAGEYRFQMAD
jgi:hypothetical protein